MIFYQHNLDNITPTILPNWVKDLARCDLARRSQTGILFLSTAHLLIISTLHCRAASKGSRLEEPRKPPLQSSPSLKSPASAHLVSLREKLQQARSEQGKRTSSTTSNNSTSTSTSTSYLPSPLTPRRKFLLASADPERTKSVSSLCSSNYNSSSGSSSYLLSPRPVRS